MQKLKKLLPNRFLLHRLPKPPHILNDWLHNKVDCNFFKAFQNQLQKED